MTNCRPIIAFILAVWLSSNFGCGGSGTVSSGDKAIAILRRGCQAIGGANAKAKLQQGQAIFGVMAGTGLKAEGSEMFRQPTIIDVAFRIPSFDRREIRDPAHGRTFVLITNGDRSWGGDLKGTGSDIPSNTSDVLHGPFTLGLIQQMLGFEEDPSRSIRAVAGDDTLQNSIDVFEGEVPIMRIVFDGDTGLPVRTVKVLPASEDEMTSEIITTLSEWRSFDAVMLPTRVSTRQDGEPVMEIELVSADLTTPVDDAVFKIPGDDPKLSLPPP